MAHFFAYGMRQRAPYFLGGLLVLVYHLFLCFWLVLKGRARQDLNLHGNRLPHVEQLGLHLIASSTSRRPQVEPAGVEPAASLHSATRSNCYFSKCLVIAKAEATATVATAARRSRRIFR